MEPIGWSALGVSVLGIVAVGATLLATWIRGSLGITTRLNELQSQVFKQADEIGKLRDEVDKCRREHAEALRRESDLILDLGHARLRIAALEKATGVSPAISELAGILIADKGKTIREFSPSLTAMIGWRAEDAVGLNVGSVLEGLPATATDPEKPGGPLIDPGRKYSGYAITKAGVRIPVWIRVRTWGEKEQFITYVVGQISKDLV